MRDPRIDKLAKTLVCFSTNVRSGDNVLIQATDANPELVKALVAEVYRAGGQPFVWLRDAGIERALLLNCTAEQLDLRARADAALMERMQVYIGVRGPQMESPAETRMFRQWGADAVGMSSVLEVIAARHMGLRVLGISCLTNKNLPDCMRPAPLEEVIAVAGRAGKDLGRLVEAVVTKL